MAGGLAQNRKGVMILGQLVELSSESFLSDRSARELGVGGEGGIPRALLHRNLVREDTCR